MKNFVLMDPSLTGPGSHHYFAAIALSQESKKNGMQFTAFSHKNYEPSPFATEEENLNAIPTFERSGYYYPFQSDFFEEFPHLFSTNNKLLDAFSKIYQQNKELFTKDSIVFFPAVTAAQIIAIANFISTIDPKESPTWGMCLMFPPEWNPNGETAQSGFNIYNMALPLLKHLEQTHRIAYTTETAGLADFYGQSLGKKPLVIPINTIQYRLGKVKSEPKPENKRILISYIGYSKEEKGTHLLPEIVKKVSRRRDDVSFMIQLMASETNITDYVKNSIESFENVRIIEGALSAEDIATLTYISDLVLLPYNAECYKIRGSTIYNECSYLGTPMVVAAGTENGDEAIENGNAIGFDKFTGQSVVDATLKALENLDDLKNIAAKVEKQKENTENDYIMKLIESL
jgi:glycosyltransferase involved in cell wall biosynthesis